MALPTPESAYFQHLASLKGVSATSFDYALPSSPTSYVLEELINGADGTAVGSGFTANGGIATGDEIVFDGSTDRIELPTLGDAGSVLDDGFGMAGWVSPDTGGTNQSWLSFFRANETAVVVQLNDDAAGEIGGFIQASSLSLSRYNFGAAGTPLGTGEQQYTVISLDPSAGTGFIMVDGVAASIVIDGVNTFPGGVAENFIAPPYLGANNAPGATINNYFAGSLRPPKLMFGATWTQAEAGMLTQTAAGGSPMLLAPNRIF